MVAQQGEQRHDRRERWRTGSCDESSDWMYGPHGQTGAESTRSKMRRLLSDFEGAAPQDGIGRDVTVAGLHLNVAAGVCTPAQATHKLLQALRLVPPSPDAKVVDVGTGSGVIAMVLWSWGCRTLAATDAVANARENARRNFAANGMNISVYGGDLLSDVEGAVDYIVFNGPAFHPARHAPGDRPTLWDPDGATQNRFVQQLRQRRAGRDMRTFFTYARFPDFDPIAAVDFTGFDVSYLLVTQDAGSETGVVMMSPAGEF